MFNFLRISKKPVPIFDKLGTDMHCHLIPGVDDGVNNVENSLACMHSLSALGFKQLFITPHFQSPRYDNNEADIQLRYANLRQQAAQAGITLNLRGVAGEYRIDDKFVTRVEENCFLQIDDKYILVELSLHQPRMGVAESIYNLQEKNHEVILAHPERYPYIALNSQLLEQLKNQDVYFQVNILSLIGFYGERARWMGYSLIERGWVEFLGSDTHNEVYIRALIAASHDRRLRKTLEKYDFLNNKL